MKSSTKYIIGAGAVVIILGGLFAWPKISNPQKNTPGKLKSLGIACLNSHTYAVSHIHPWVEIYIDNQRQEAIPANIGISSGCMAEIHTHDGSGKLHVESVKAGKQFTPRQFFDVWGESFEKEGYDLEITVDGKITKEAENLVFKDGQKIILNYTSQTNSGVFPSN